MFVCSSLIKDIFYIAIELIRKKFGEQIFFFKVSVEEIYEADFWRFYFILFFNYYVLDYSSTDKHNAGCRM